MNTMIHLQTHKPQSGFSLIEVLVALFILSVGLMGLAALQTTSLQFNTDSYTRTQATLLAYDIIDRMRANTIGLNNGDYDVNDATEAASVRSSYSGVNCGTGACTSDVLAIYDLGQWYDRMESLLPESTTSGKLATVVRDPVVTSPTFNRVTVTISWRERDLNKTQQWLVQL